MGEPRIAMNKFQAVFLGVCAGILGAFPAVWLVSQVYRFPGLVGVLERDSRLSEVAFTVIILGVFLGGFPLLSLLGGLAGATIHAALARNVWAITACTVLATLCIDLVVAVLFAVLYWRWRDA